MPRARALDLDAEHYLNDNDSYSFFAQAGGLLITGPTGTNVNDLMFGLAY
jgi:glycerate-2-kinase